MLISVLSVEKCSHERREMEDVFRRADGGVKTEIMVWISRLHCHKYVAIRHPDKTTARSHLQEWLEFAYSHEIKKLTKFCNKFKKYIEYVLKFYDSPISTGPLEGVNNKIKNA